MAPEQQRLDRDDAVRAMLAEVVDRRPARGVFVASGERGRVWLVTAVVLVVVVGLSVLAIRLGDAGRRPDGLGGRPASPAPAVRPSPTIPPGELLGRFTSADGPVQTHTIRPDGLAIASVFTCTGRGAYLVSIAHDSDTGGSGGCNAGATTGSKGVAGSTTVRIRTAAGMRWTLTIVGIPETYVTPRPVLTPTTATGGDVPFCTAAGLAARFEPVQEPDGVTEVAGGQIALTNTTRTTCALAGYPMVRFVDHGAVLGHHTMAAIDDRSSDEQGLKPVVLAPGGTAYTQIDWYLPNYYPANGQGRCESRAVTTLRIDLANRLAGAAQTGSLTVPIGHTVTACLNGPWGTGGKYGQLSSTVFVDYSLGNKR